MGYIYIQAPVTYPVLCWILGNKSEELIWFSSCQHQVNRLSRGRVWSRKKAFTISSCPRSYDSIMASPQSPLRRSNRLQLRHRLYQGIVVWPEASSFSCIYIFSCVKMGILTPTSVDTPRIRHSLRVTILMNKWDVTEEQKKRPSLFPYCWWMRPWWTKLSWPLGKSWAASVTSLVSPA